MDVDNSFRNSKLQFGMAFFNHSVGLTNDDLKALIASAVSYGGPGILIPTRNTQLLRWCLDKGVKLSLIHI